MSMPADAISTILGLGPLHLWTMRETAAGGLSGSHTFSDEVVSGPGGFSSWQNMPLDVPGSSTLGLGGGGWGTLYGYRHNGGPQTQGPLFTGDANAYAVANQAGALSSWLNWQRTSGNPFPGYGILVFMDSQLGSPTKANLYSEAAGSSSTNHIAFTWGSSSLTLGVHDDSVNSGAGAPGSPFGVAGGSSGSGRVMGGQLLGVSVSPTGAIQFYRNGMFTIPPTTLMATSYTFTNASMKSYVGADPQSPSTNFPGQASSPPGQVGFRGSLAWVCLLPFGFTADDFYTIYCAICPEYPNGQRWSQARSGVWFPRSQFFSQKLPDNTPVDPNSNAILTQWLTYDAGMLPGKNFGSGPFAFGGTAASPAFDLDHSDRRSPAWLRVQIQGISDEVQLGAKAHLPLLWEMEDPEPQNLGSDGISTFAEPSMGRQNDTFQAWTTDSPRQTNRYPLWSAYTGRPVPITPSGTPGRATGLWYYTAGQLISLLGSTNVSGVSVSGSTVTVTIASASGYAVGHTVCVDGLLGFSANTPQGLYVITAISGNQVSFVVPTAPTGSYASGGTCWGDVYESASICHMYGTNVVAKITSGPNSVQIPIFIVPIGQPVGFGARVYARGPYPIPLGATPDPHVNDLWDYGLIATVTTFAPSWAASTFTDDGTVTPNLAHQPLQSFDSSATNTIGTNNQRWAPQVGSAPSDHPNANQSGQIYLALRPSPSDTNLATVYQTPGGNSSTGSGGMRGGPTGRGTIITIGTLGAGGEIANVRRVINRTLLQLDAPLTNSHSVGDTVSHQGNEYGGAGSAYCVDSSSRACGGSYGWWLNQAYNPSFQLSWLTTNGMSASSCPGSAGVLMIEELLNGYIPHTIGLAMPSANHPDTAYYQGRRWPAPRHDGRATGSDQAASFPSGHIQLEGMHYRFPPGYNAEAPNIQYDGRSTITGDISSSSSPTVIANLPTGANFPTRLIKGCIVFTNGPGIPSNNADPTFITAIDTVAGTATMSKPANATQSGATIYTLSGTLGRAQRALIIALRDYGMSDHDSGVGGGGNYIEDTPQTGRQEVPNIFRGYSSGLASYINWQDFIYQGFAPFTGTLNNGSNEIDAVTCVFQGQLSSAGVITSPTINGQPISGQASWVHIGQKIDAGLTAGGAAILGRGAFIKSIVTSGSGSSAIVTSMTLFTAPLNSPDSGYGTTITFIYGATRGSTITCPQIAGAIPMQSYVTSLQPAAGKIFLSSTVTVIGTPTGVSLQSGLAMEEQILSAFRFGTKWAGVDGNPANAEASFTATVTPGSPILTSVPDATFFALALGTGALLGGPGIPNEAVVAPGGVDAAHNTITMSDPAVGAGGSGVTIVLGRRSNRTSVLDWTVPGYQQLDPA